VPRQELPAYLDGATTPNGVSTGEIPPWTLSLDYTRRFANFDFKTGVNSVLKWDDMVFNELTARIDGNFKLKNYDLFAYAEYGMGSMSSAGFSMDYDLEPYDHNQKDVGIFTISVGKQSGTTDHMKFGFGAKNIWDIGGWKLSPSIGYEIFHHNLEMSDHYYPNPAVYIPLLTPDGQYIFGDADGNYFAVNQSQAQQAVDEGYYQVCLSPEDIALATVSNGAISMTGYTYDPNNPYLPWGVGPGQCVIIGGDGAILVSGTTHIYNTTWSGIYLGLEVEKQLTWNDKLRFYLQVGMPNYSSEGIWPNRTDWQQNPSFIDKGSNGSYSYLAEMEYNYKMSDRLNLSLKVDTNLYHVGGIPGELYVAGYTDYEYYDDGATVVWRDNGGTGAVCAQGSSNTCLPSLVTIDPHTEYIADSLKYAQWQSFGLHIGVKYSF
jgi:hypothetical protein